MTDVENWNEVALRDTCQSGARISANMWLTEKLQRLKVNPVLLPGNGSGNHNVFVVYQETEIVKYASGPKLQGQSQTPRKKFW